METNNQTIAKRKDKNQELILEQLKKTPIIQVACEKVGIGRATYYRWIAESPDFYQKTLDAVRNGREYLNDLMEYKLVQKAINGELTAIIFFLKYNHPRYSDRWDAIKPEDITTIVEYLKYTPDDHTKDRTFIANLFEKRLPYHLAKQVLDTMKQLRQRDDQEEEKKKIDLLYKLQKK